MRPWALRSHLIADRPRPRGQVTLGRLVARWVVVTLLALAVSYLVYGLLTRAFPFEPPSLWLYQLHDTVALWVYGWTWVYPAPLGGAFWLVGVALAGFGLAGYLTGRSFFRALQVRATRAAILRWWLHPVLVLWYRLTRHSRLAPLHLEQVTEFERLDALEQIDGDVRRAGDPVPARAFLGLLASTRLKRMLYQRDRALQLKSLALTWDAYVRLRMAPQAGEGACAQLAGWLRQDLQRVRADQGWADWHPSAAQSALEPPALLLDMERLLAITAAPDPAARPTSATEVRRALAEAVGRRRAELEALAGGLGELLLRGGGRLPAESTPGAAGVDQARWLGLIAEGVALLFADEADMPHAARAHLDSVEALALTTELLRARADFAATPAIAAIVAMVEGLPSESGCFRAARMVRTYRGSASPAATVIDDAAPQLLQDDDRRTLAEPIVGLLQAAGRDGETGSAP